MRLNMTIKANISVVCSGNSLCCSWRCSLSPKTLFNTSCSDIARSSAEKFCFTCMNKKLFYFVGGTESGRGVEDGWVLLIAAARTSIRSQQSLLFRNISAALLRTILHEIAGCPRVYSLEIRCGLLSKYTDARWKRFFNTHDCFKGGMNLDMASSFHLPRSNSTRETIENTSSESSDNETAGKANIIIFINIHRLTM